MACFSMSTVFLHQGWTKVWGIYFEYVAHLQTLVNCDHIERPFPGNRMLTLFAGDPLVFQDRRPIDRRLFHDAGFWLNPSISNKPY